MLKKLNKVDKKNKVSLVWIPDCSGIKEVDVAARKVAQMSLTAPEPFCDACLNGQSCRGHIKEEEEEPFCGVVEKLKENHSLRVFQ